MTAFEKDVVHKSRKTELCFFEFSITLKENARGAIRTHEFLRKWVLSPSPLTWLGNPRTTVVFIVVK